MSAQSAQTKPTQTGDVLTKLVLLALLLYVAWLVWSYYFGTATVYLKNESVGHSMFYVDGVSACNAPAGTQCAVFLHLGKPHTLTATTMYDIGQYRTPPFTLTPPVQLIPWSKIEYQYISCGVTGKPEVDCGLFASHGSTY